MDFIYRACHCIDKLDSPSLGTSDTSKRYRAFIALYLLPTVYQKNKKSTAKGVILWKKILRHQRKRERKRRWSEKKQKRTDVRAIVQVQGFMRGSTLKV